MCKVTTEFLYRTEQDIEFDILRRYKENTWSLQRNEILFLVQRIKYAFLKERTFGRCGGFRHEGFRQGQPLGEGNRIEKVQGVIRSEGFFSVVGI